MSKEFKAPRKFSEIQQEYMQLCVRVGDSYFKRASLEKDLAVLVEQLQELGLEATAAQAAAAEEAKKKAEEDKAKAAEEKPADEAPKAEEEVKSNE